MAAWDLGSKSGIKGDESGPNYLGLLLFGLFLAHILKLSPPSFAWSQMPVTSMPTGCR